MELTIAAIKKNKAKIILFGLYKGLLNEKSESLHWALVITLYKVLSFWTFWVNYFVHPCMLSSMYKYIVSQIVWNYGKDTIGTATNEKSINNKKTITNTILNRLIRISKINSCKALTSHLRRWKKYWEKELLLYHLTCAQKAL